MRALMIKDLSRLKNWTARRLPMFRVAGRTFHSNAFHLTSC